MLARVQELILHFFYGGKRTGTIHLGKEKVYIYCFLGTFACIAVFLYYGVEDTML